MTTPADAKGWPTTPHQKANDSVTETRCAYHLILCCLVRRIESFFFELRRVRLVVHAGIAPILRIIQATRGRGISIEIGSAGR